MEEADEADGQISKVVMISEPLRVRSWWRSSPGTMSLTRGSAKSVGEGV